MTFAELTEEQISDLKYFWEEKGDIERYCDFEKLKPQIQEQLPELLKAWYDYKASIKIMMKLTEEDRKMYDRATEFAPAKQLFMMAWWDIFCPKKREKLHKCITTGMHWNAAYMIAKNWR